VYASSQYAFYRAHIAGVRAADHYIGRACHYVKPHFRRLSRNFKRDGKLTEFNSQFLIELKLLLGVVIVGRHCQAHTRRQIGQSSHLL
jgi:hypothetical protein